MTDEENDLDAIESRVNIYARPITLVKICHNLIAEIRRLRQETR